MSLAPYPSPVERDEQLSRLAGAAGAELVEYGRSVQGEALRAAVVDDVGPDAPKVLCTANIHGPEFVAGQVAMGLLSALAPDGLAAGLRARAQVWVVPCLNPDGYRQTWERGGVGALPQLRPNARGVDLNRNFPLPRGRPSRLPGAGSSRPGDATYRGQSPLCEPETRHLDELLQAQRFHASANFHSFMGTVIPARVTERSSFRHYRNLCRAFAGAQPRTRYRRLSSRLFDVFTGEQEDHQHHRHDCWAVCVESFSILASYRQHARAPNTFWRFNPHDLDAWERNDVPGLIAYYQAALDLPRPTLAGGTGGGEIVS